MATTPCSLCSPPQFLHISITWHFDSCTLCRSNNNKQHLSGASTHFLVAQTVNHLSTMQETWVQSLGWEDPLEKKMAVHSSTIAWKIPWTEEPGRLQSMGSHKVGHNWVTPLFFGIGIKSDLFHYCGHAKFSTFASILSVALSQHHLLGFVIAQLEFNHLH